MLERETKQQKIRRNGGSNQLRGINVIWVVHGQTSPPKVHLHAERHCLKSIRIVLVSTLDSSASKHKFRCTRTEQMDSKYSDMLLSWGSWLLRPFRALLGHNPSSHLSPPIDFSKSRRCYRYDVFISFRGPDTRNTFVDHLYAHLVRKGIYVFKDDKWLRKGESISPQLLQAIQDSRVSIIVFSKNYAHSRWCLDEMAAIAECQTNLKQIVFPVFYDVDPSPVRNQNGVYENAFVLHTQKFKHDPDKVNRWKKAMNSLAGSAGWDIRNKPEFPQIENIVEEVIKVLAHKFSWFADGHLIGIQARVEALESLLKLNSEDDDFQVVGIWGMGGIGKTTLAKALYNRISHQFDSCCFLDNVSKIYRDGGVTAVQKQILHQTVKETNLETYGPSEISGMVRNRLRCLRFLVVLDNVDQLKQLEDLSIDPKLFSRGSKMIITTRDEHILKVYGAHVVHEVSLMNNDDACELFYSKAFKRGGPTRCKKLAPEVLKYVQGLPLAIEVTGSFLCTRHSTEWTDALNRLKNNPDKEIMDVLQISFEGLNPEEKEIFLHIACFFNGEKKNHVKRILDACALNLLGIKILIERSLITIRNQEVHMHEMLQDLGKKIVRQQSIDEPGSWSRLWLYKDFHRVLMTKTGNNKVKAIVLDRKEDISVYPRLSAEGLSIMKGLKILILYHKNISGNLQFLSNNLQYLLWHGYPFASLPSNFEPFLLVELNMPYSSIQQLWEGSKDLYFLKRLDLSNSIYLTETPNFEGSRRLKRLDFTGCTNLLQVHPSIGLLTELSFLSLEGCSSLVNLDLGTVCELNSLGVLHLSGCTKLERVPNFTGVSNLEYLDIDQCVSLSTVDESIGHLTKLKFLSLRDCTNLTNIPKSVNNLESLTTLDLFGCLKLEHLPLESPCNLQSLIFLDLGFCSLSEVPDAIEGISYLERLNLEGNNFVSLPSSLGKIPTLAYLNLAHCSKLEFLPELQWCATDTDGGWYFKTFTGSYNHRSGLYIFNCPTLEITGLNLALLWLESLVKNPCHFRCGFDIVVPANRIPLWCGEQYKRGFRVRTVDYYFVNEPDNWLGFAFCVAFKENYFGTVASSSNDSIYSQLPYPLYLSFESELTEETFDMPLRLDLDKVDGSNSSHLWLIYISRPHCHFVETRAHVTFKAHPGLEIIEWGFSMVLENGIFHSPTEFEVHYPLDYVHESSSSSSGSKIQIPLNWLPTESSSSSVSKFHVPYNWYVTEEEESENMEVDAEKKTSIKYGI